MLLKLKVRPTAGNTLPTSEITILRLGTALQKAIQKSYTKINVKVFAIFKQESMVKQYYVYAAIANTIKDYGVKESFRSLAQVLDGPPFLQISQGKLNYNIELSNHVEVWFESGYDADKLYIVIRARELTTQRELTRIYQNDKAVQEVKRSQFQELSPLLYCKLIQLNEDEYKEQNGMVTLMAFNGSLELFTRGDKRDTCLHQRIHQTIRHIKGRGDDKRCAFVYYSNVCSMYGTLHLVTILALKVPSTQAASIDVYKPRPEVTQKSSDGVYVTNAATT